MLGDAQFKQDHSFKMSIQTVYSISSFAYAVLFDAIVVGGSVVVVLPPHSSCLSASTTTKFTL